MHKKLIQALQATLAISGLLKFPVQLYFGIVDLVAIAEFVHFALEIVDYYHKK